MMVYILPFLYIWLSMETSSMFHREQLTLQEEVMLISLERMLVELTSQDASRLI
jgi:hypothetical protein